MTTLADLEAGNYPDGYPALQEDDFLTEAEWIDARRRSMIGHNVDYDGQIVTTVSARMIGWDITFVTYEDEDGRKFECDMRSDVWGSPIVRFAPPVTV